MQGEILAKEKAKTILERLSALEGTLDTIESTLGPMADAEQRLPSQPGVVPSIDECIDRLGDLQQQAARIFRILREAANKLG